MKSSSYFLAAFLLFLLYACEKETDRDSDSYQHVRIVNYSTADLDTVTIWSEGSGTMVFTGIDAGAMSDFQDFSNLALDLYFRLDTGANFQGSNFSIPGNAIDPTVINRYTTCPDGWYSFGVFDSPTGDLLVTLAQFYH